MKIKPKMTNEELHEMTTLTLEDGRVHHKGLPPIWTDAQWAAKADAATYPSDWHDPKGFENNRKLAEAITDAFKKYKPSDDKGDHFVLAWRLYPNAEHPRWQREEPHSCGCGCGGLGNL